MQKRYWWKHFTSDELRAWAGHTKVCPHCHRLKEIIDGFGLARVKRKDKPAGIRSKGYCFDCRSELGMLRVQRNFPERWAKRLDVLKSLHGKPEYQNKEYNRLRQKRNRLQYNQWKLESIRRNPEKHLARLLARLAYPEVQTCVVPGCNKPGQRHHPDYSKPLEIVWLCTTHHEDVHHRGATYDQHCDKQISSSNIPKLPSEEILDV